MLIYFKPSDAITLFVTQCLLFARDDMRITVRYHMVILRQVTTYLHVVFIMCMLYYELLRCDIAQE